MICRMLWCGVASLAASQSSEGTLLVPGYCEQPGTLPIVFQVGPRGPGCLKQSRTIFTVLGTVFGFPVVSLFLTCTIVFLVFDIENRTEMDASEIA